MRVAEATLALAVVALRVHRPFGHVDPYAADQSRRAPVYASSRLRLLVAPTPDLDHAVLQCLIGCPAEALEFTRVSPIELAHGCKWAKRNHLESFRWHFLDRPVIHGPAVGIRCGVRWPGECESQRPFSIRPLTEWEGNNALRWLRDESTQLGRRHCPVDAAFTGSLCHPQLVEYREADEAGKLAIWVKTRAEQKARASVMKQKIAAELATDRIRYLVGAWLVDHKAAQQELSRR